MAEVSSEDYWIDEFQVSTRDLDRIADRMRKNQTAYDLTGLARRMVQGRLRHGAERGPTATGVLDDSLVRPWDPAAEWQPGDHVIVIKPIVKGVYEPLTGEVREIQQDRVVMDLDGEKGQATYMRAAPGSTQAIHWRNMVGEAIRRMKVGGTEEQLADSIFLLHGERIGSQLLSALQADERFIRLAGRWFLRELAAPPSDEQIASLAWAMLGLDEPTPTAKLSAFVDPPLTAGDPGLFGLYLSMRKRADLFENADPGQRPRWRLAGPPPGSFTPSNAAYDPDTYQVLCVPGESAPPQVVQRLWELELLGAVV